MRLRAVDLFCKAGGASMGLHRAGFDVVGVDIEPQPNYPFEFVQADALTFDLCGFDFVWASPPCQKHVAGLAAVNVARGRKLCHVDLIDKTRARLIESGTPYIIENVVGAPLVNPVMLCGSSFGLPVRRHRLFECPQLLLTPTCRHDLQREKKYPTNFRPGGKKVLATVVQVYGNAEGTHLWGGALGADWMTSKELTQAIPPAYSEYLGKQIIEMLNAD